MYDPYVYHLDLCILAYQLYNQTLIWPLDPWYERMRRKGTSRREKFMEMTHAFFAGKPDYRGPGATRNWRTCTDLDPIIGKYTRISPWRACFTRDDAKYRVFNTPAAITNQISDVYIYEYESDPAWHIVDLTRGNPREVSHVHTDKDGADALYAFEGGTGATVEGKVISANDPAWSLMGCVLQRMREDRGYDIHIVFRGSQSGAAGPAAISGLITESGNPDWVTDTDAYTTVSTSIVSRQGEVSRGFSNSIRLCLNSIAACLNDIHHNRGHAPVQIYVTGHSLGGALAAQFASAVVLGQYGENLGDDLSTWPWSRLKLITYGAPTVGNKAFQAAFNARIDCKRIKVKGDPITQEKINEHVGAEIELPSDYLLNTAAHEPALIRSKLMENAIALGIDLTGIPAPATTVGRADEPWQVFETFWQMYDGHAMVRAQLAEIVTAEFARDLDAYVARFREIIDLNSTYRSPMTRQTVKDELIRRLDAAFAPAAVASVGELKTRIGQIAGVLDDQDEFLALCLTLREVLRPDAGLTIAQAKGDAEVTESTYA